LANSVLLSRSSGATIGGSILNVVGGWTSIGGGGSGNTTNGLYATIRGLP
jgi:hypothetical protein